MKRIYGFIAALLMFIVGGLFFAGNAEASSTYSRCSVSRSNQYICTIWWLSRNANGDRVVKPIEIQVWNSSASAATLVGCSYFKQVSGFPVYQRWDPQRTTAAGGVGFYTTPFDSLGLANPGMGVNCYLTGNAGTFLFTTYSTPTPA